MSGPERWFVDHLDTPIGRMALAVDAAGRLRATGFTDGEPELARALLPGERAVELGPAHDPGGVTSRLARYFAGDIPVLDGIAVEFGGTEFQRAVWQALRAIPGGETISYSELTRRIGRPRAVRAVGLANGANPVGVVVPCHRVIGQDGSLTGYGFGLPRKRWLLAHERRARPGHQLGFDERGGVLVARSDGGRD
jgi:methylated-DNA-[protein]-cysteine S-methyltransferase